ncbi:MAG: hypothetical protein J7K98_03835 [Candidatus Aenigmarchaeota archaeon]|nr:hypothetical protein [Candidatus Aenigmarchaeota archaeon]
MEILYFIPQDKYQEARNRLLKDDAVSRASITFKEAKTLGVEKDGFFCYVSGTEEICRKAIEILEEFGEKVEEEEEIIKKIKEEEDTAIQGFGGIFG